MGLMRFVPGRQRTAKSCQISTGRGKESAPTTEKLLYTLRKSPSCTDTSIGKMSIIEQLKELSEHIIIGKEFLCPGQG